MSKRNTPLRLAAMVVACFVAFAAYAQTTKPATTPSAKPGKLVIVQDAEIKEIINNEKKDTPSSAPAEKKKKEPVTEKPASEKDKKKEDPTTDKKKTTPATPADKEKKGEGEKPKKEDAPTAPASTTPERPNKETTAPPAAPTTTPLATLPTVKEPATEKKEKAEPADNSYTSRMVRTRYKAKGFRIQIYTGGNTRNHREQANEIAQKSRQAVPELSTYIQFQSPHWICRVGDFRNRADAERYARKLRSAGVSRETRIVSSDVLLAR